MTTPAATGPAVPLQRPGAVPATDASGTTPGWTPTLRVVPSPEPGAAAAQSASLRPRIPAVAVGLLLGLLGLVNALVTGPGDVSGHLLAFAGFVVVWVAARGRGTAGQMLVGLSGLLAALTALVTQ